jgi:hypothetical protein
MKAEPGPPMTLGNAAKAMLRLIVWYRSAGDAGDEASRLMILANWSRKSPKGLEALRELETY